MPLIGDHHRCAAALILVLGIVALVTGSPTPLSLLVVDLVLMWAIATLRHAHLAPGRPVAN